MHQIPIFACWYAAQSLKPAPVSASSLAPRFRDFPSGKLRSIAKSKSGRPRDVVLSDEGAAFFASITVGRAAEPLFLRNSRPWRRSEQTRPMKAACERARIAPAVSFHALRHTWASLAVMAGMPLMVVARNLGHVDTRMVEQHYGHLREDLSIRPSRIMRRAMTSNLRPREFAHCAKSPCVLALLRLDI